MPSDVELEVGQMAMGGGCAAKAPDGRVVFVRHALPGERVRARVTEQRARYLRADAVEILDVSRDRVTAPCPHAGPGHCGGCDWQHVELGAQRRLKAALVAEALRGLARLEVAPVVEPVPGDVDGLGWRVRARFAADDRGRLGFRRYRSHALELVNECRIASERVEALGPERRLWPGAAEVEAIALGGETLCRVARVNSRLRSPNVFQVDGGLVIDRQPVQGPGWLHEDVAGRRFRVSAGSFWQVHVGAPELLSDVVLGGLDPQPGEAAVDLYAGVGLLAAALGERVGPKGSVLAVERGPRAHADLVANTADLPQLSALRASVTPRLMASGLGKADLVLLDPPRSGAGTAVMAALAELRPPPRRVGYVSCNATTFARDLRVLLDHGWALDSLRAFDMFPMTEHVELVGFLVPPDSTG
ncbi:MAG: class I SAM-dependent RNA methyltransferase [Acidimicrobiales bacterium]